MRKIESLMVQAIKDRRDWKSSNTEVITSPAGPLAYVYLHDNLIAVYNYCNKELMISDAGWQSNTTKSRLNAILTELKGYAYGIAQRKFEWFLSDKNGESDMYSNTWYEIDALNIGV